MSSSAVDTTRAASTAEPDDRWARPSPNAHPSGSAASLLLAQIHAEIRQNLRLPEFMIVVVALPVLLYAMFGLAEAGEILPGGTDVGAMLYASLSAYGIISLAIFTFGVDVARERGNGWLRRLRATPMPMWAYFAGKAAMAVVYSVAIIAAVGLVGVLAGGVELAPARLVRTALVLVCGALAFSTMGYALGFWARPRAAAAVGNLIFLPLAFTSGLFYPLDAIPSVLQDVAPYMPTYHFGQLVWNQIAPLQDVMAFGSPEPDALIVHAAWVAGCFVVFGVLAAVGYRRDLVRNHR